MALSPVGLRSEDVLDIFKEKSEAGTRPKILAIHMENSPIGNRDQLSGCDVTKWLRRSRVVGRLPVQNSIWNSWVMGGGGLFSELLCYTNVQKKVENIIKI
jgi:hypothetical protein